MILKCIGLLLIACTYSFKKPENDWFSPKNDQRCFQYRTLGNEDYKTYIRSEEYVDCFKFLIKQSYKRKMR